MSQRPGCWRWRLSSLTSPRSSWSPEHWRLAPAPAPSPRCAGRAPGGRASAGAAPRNSAPARPPLAVAPRRGTQATTRGELVEWRMSCGGNRLGRTHAGRKLLQKLKKRALSTLGRCTYLNRLMGEHACQTPCRELLIPIRGQVRRTRVNWTLLSITSTSADEDTNQLVLIVVHLQTLRKNPRSMLCKLR